MKERLILVGAGGLGRVVLEYARNSYDCSFVDDSGAVEVDGVSIVGKIADISQLFPQFKLLLVTIGNNALRERVYSIAEKIGFSFPNIAHPSAYISPRAHIGVGNVILNNVVIQNNARMGNGCILNSGVELHHDSCIGNNVLIYTNSVVRSLAYVGDRVMIGSTTTIPTNMTVPSDSTIKDGMSFRS